MPSKELRRKNLRLLYVKRFIFAHLRVSFRHLKRCCAISYDRHGWGRIRNFIIGNILQTILSIFCTIVEEQRYLEEVSDQRGSRGIFFPLSGESDRFEACMMLGDSHALLRVENPYQTTAANSEGANATAMRQMMQNVAAASAGRKKRGARCQLVSHH